MVTKMERSLGIFSLGIWVLVAVLFGVALGIFLKKQLEKQEQTEYQDWLIDLASEKEKLPSAFEDIAKKNPNYGYITTSNQSKYTEVLGKHLYNDKNGEEDNSLANALASGVGILSNRKVEPIDFAFGDEEEFEDVKNAAASKYGIAIESLEAINANILNYYLDNGGVVVFFAKGKTPYSEEGRAILVFGGYLADGIYTIFSPEQNSTLNDTPRTELIPKTTLFGGLKSEIKFYVLTTMEV